jgi:8-hydroxy-5-deazaflavin:NADPH oxidoreductase
MKVGIIGYGQVGKNLADLIADAGHEVIVGIRKTPISMTETAHMVTSMREAARDGDTVIIAIPFTACADVLPAIAQELEGKVVIDATNPLKADWSPLLLGEENSAGEEIARALPKSRIVKAFNTVFADVMRTDKLTRGTAQASAFICGDKLEAVEQVAHLAREIGFEPLATGPLKNARYLEGMAHLNISIAVGQNGGTNAAFLYHQD